jgi:hypothetical protein
MNILNPISLDDPEFFQKINSARPDLFNQEQMAKLIEDEKAEQISSDAELTEANE